MFSKLVSAASFIPLVSAANFAIQVGVTGDTFTPNSVTAAVGDTVTFTFTGSRHSVVQSTFEDPCDPLSGGFSVPAQGQTAEFIVNVTTTDPLYFYCSVLGHCGSGMVGIINPGAHSASDFATAASGKSSVSPPNEPQGGVYVDNAGVSTTGAAAATTAGATSATTATSGTITTTRASTAPSASATSKGLGNMATAVPAAFALVAGAVAAMV